MAGNSITVKRPSVSGRRRTLDTLKSNPSLPSLIFSGTGTVAFFILLAWLVITALIGRPVRNSNLYHVALGHFEGVAPSGFDPTHALGSNLSDFLKRHEKGSVVLIQGGATSRANGSAETRGAYLLAPAAAPGSAPIPLPLDDVLRAIRDRGPNANTLLILDVAVSPADRDLGVFGNTFQSELSQKVKVDSNFAVLTACAEGQSSAQLEGGGSVFAHYVQEALNGQNLGGWVRADQLHAYVQPRVARWVKEHGSGAVQTPMLLGRPDLRIRLNEPIRQAATTDLKPAHQDEDDQKLTAEWKHRDNLSRSSPPPYRYNPLSWRRYQDLLLLAERLFRSGEREAAIATLDAATRERPTLTEDSNPPAPSSLAELRRVSPDGPEEADRNKKQIARLLDSLARGSRVSPPDLTPKTARVARDAQGESNVGVARPGEADTQVGPAQKADVALKGEDTSGVDPLEFLTRGGDELHPTYVEAQLAVWYAKFVKLGGETDALRGDRLALIRKAVAVREEAEEAAFNDPRVFSRIAPIVDKADSLRRVAQDALFAGDANQLKACISGLENAGRLYKQAHDEGTIYVQSHDLLELVQDTLPSLGEWVARSCYSKPAGNSQGPEDRLRETAEYAATLADLVYADAGTKPVVVSQIEAARASLETSFRALQDHLRNRVKVASDQREIDALLRESSIVAEERLVLLQRARNASHRPAPITVDGLESVIPDETFLKEVRAQASLERDLLLIAGTKLSDFDRTLKKIDDEWRRSSNAAFEFDDLGSQLSRARGNLPATDRATRLAIARTIPSIREAQGAGRAHIESAKALREWYLARHAKDCNEPDPGGIDLVMASNTDAGTIRNATVRVTGHFPEGGRAAVFLEHDPAAQVTATPLEGGLIAVDAVQPATVSFVTESRQPGRLSLTPCAFFRGRFYLNESAFNLFQTELVKVEIHGETEYKVDQIVGKKNRLNLKKFKIDDQFLNNQHTGYFHVGNDLPYWLRVKNVSKKALSLVVLQELDGIRNEHKLALKPGQATGMKDLPDLPGKVLASKADKAKQLTVTVREEDANGPELCAPFKVQFNPIDPRDYVRRTFFYSSPIVSIGLEHLATDPVPYPVNVDLILEPINDVRERIQDNVLYIPRGGKPVVREFELLNQHELKDIKITGKVNKKDSEELSKPLSVNRLPEKAKSQKTEDAATPSTPDP